MDRSQHQRSGGGDDRLSKLEDHVLGHILSFLPAKEAARAALLSLRWRDVFAGVHTVSMEEPESPLIDEERLWQSAGCSYCGPYPDPDGPPAFSATVAAALLGRHRRCGAVPLRALRVAMEGYHHRKDAATLDQCVSYAVQQAGPALDVDLRLCCRLDICNRPYALGCSAQAVEDEDDDQGPLQGIGIPVVRSPTIQNANAMPDSDHEEESHPPPQLVSDMGPGSDIDGSFVVASEDSDDEERAARDRDCWPGMPVVYMVPRVLFSCATLRSLSLSRLALRCCHALVQSLPVVADETGL